MLVEKVNPFLPPLRYGQAMESTAVQMFSNLYKERHQNAKDEECGIFLCKDLLEAAQTGLSIAIVVENPVWKLNAPTQLII